MSSPSGGSGGVLGRMGALEHGWWLLAGGFVPLLRLRRTGSTDPGPTSMGKVPADEPHGLDLAVRGESLIRLTTQCSAMVLGGSGCDGCVSWFSPVGLRQRRRAVARDDVVVCRDPEGFFVFLLFLGSFLHLFWTPVDLRVSAACVLYLSI